MSRPKSVFDPAPPRATDAQGKPRPRANGLAKRGKFRLAAACVEVMSDEDVAWWLREIMAGRDPDAPRNADGTLKLELGGFVTPITMRDRLAAAKLFLERRNGQAPASIVVEEHLQITATQQPPELSPARVREMDPAVKAELRRALKAATGKVLPAQVAAARDANPTD